MLLTRKEFMMKVIRRVPGIVQPLYPTEYRQPYDGNPQPGMEGATLRRDGQPVNKAAANQLAQKIAAERAERIRTQGHS